MKEKAWAWTVGIGFNIGTNRDSKDYYVYYYDFYYASFRAWNSDYDSYLRTLRWAMGRKYSNFSWKGKESKVFTHLYNIEEGMFTLVNLLYTLYTGNLKADDTEYNLFKPYAEILQSYGNTFEEVVSTIREVVILTGENF